MEKLNTMKNETNSLHTDILGIDELKQSEIGHFQSENRTVYFSKHKKIKRTLLFSYSQEGYSKDSILVQCR